MQRASLLGAASRQPLPVGCLPEALSDGIALGVEPITRPSPPCSLRPAPTINGIITTGSLVIVSVHPTDAKSSPFRPIYTITAIPDNGGLTVTVTSKTNAVVVRGLAKNMMYTITAVLQGSYESLVARTQLV